MTATLEREPDAQRVPRPVADRKPRRPRDITGSDIATLGGSAISAFFASWLLFDRFTRGGGPLAIFLCTYALFLLIYWVVSREQLGALVANDRITTIVLVSAAVLVVVPLGWLIISVTLKGIVALRATFFTADQTGITPVMESTAGGGLHAIIGTVEQVGLALLWSLPLGLAAAVFLNESRSPWRRPVRIFVDAMSGLPSVIAGLFIFSALILPYANTITLFGFNGFMASLALAVTMLPTIIRTVEVVLRLVPDGLREASLALGSSRVRTVWSVVFPTARTGMATAVVLGIARSVGETAPLLFTSFGYDLMNTNPFEGPQESLPLFVYRNIRKPDASAIERGFAGALVLMLMILVLFAVARIVGRDRTASQSRKSNRAAKRAVARRTALATAAPGGAAVGAGLGADASRSAASPPDASLPDVALPDASLPDVSLPDAGAPDDD